MCNRSILVLKRLVTIVVLGLIFQVATCAQPSQKTIQWYDPIELVVPRHFDIMAKYIYAQAYEWGVKSSWPRELYREHLHVMVNYRDNTDGKKRFFHDFVCAYDATLQAIKERGFDATSSTISLGYDGVAFNGAHRIAACLLYQHMVAGKISAHESPVHATADFLRHWEDNVKGGLKEKYLDAMALQYCMLKKNTYLTFLSSDNAEKIRKVINFYGAIVYEKTAHLTATGYHHLCEMLCEQSGEHNQQKMMVKVILFEMPTSSVFQECKRMIDGLQDEKDILHVTSTYDQTLALTQTLCNANGIAFINRVSLGASPELDAMIDDFKNMVRLNNLNPEFFCLVGDTAQALCTDTRCATLDIIHHTNEIPAGENAMIRSYNSRYRGKSVDDIIFNPQHYFYYRGIKCALMR